MFVLLLAGLLSVACGGTQTEAPTGAPTPTLSAGAAPAATGTPTAAMAPSTPAADGQAEPTASSDGSAPTAVPAPDSPADEPTTTPVAQVGWRTDGEVGGNLGQIAPNTQVGLGDGTQASLEQIADGRALLLYFFETW